MDGRPVDVEEGATVLDAAAAAGVDVPTLCFDERLAPVGACRVCLVGVEGRRAPVAACTTPVGEDMVVRTDDPAAVAQAKSVLELLVSELPERALDVPAQRSELVRVCGRLGVDARRFGEAVRDGGRDDSHPYVKLDRDLCIACSRCVRMCDEVQGTFALSLVGPRVRHRGGAGLGRRLGRLGLRELRRLRRLVPDRGAVGAGSARPAGGRRDDHDDVWLLRGGLLAGRAHA